MKRNHRRQNAISLIALGVLLAGVSRTFAQTGPPSGGSASTPPPAAPDNGAPQEVIVQSGDFTIVSVTSMRPGEWDVKLRNPRTGYVHSLTLLDEPVAPFAVGKTTKQIKFSDGRICLEVARKRYSVRY
jgi:hypothetical protein